MLALDDDTPAQSPLSDAHVVRIAGASADMPWYDAAAHSYTSLDDARAAGLWTHPTTKRERARCAVFAELHARGYFMGNGLKFGCHFLVYPGALAAKNQADGAGDPLRFHSHFSATVFESSEDTRIAPLDLVAYGRLATGVKKAHLLCTYDEPTGEIGALKLSMLSMHCAPSGEVLGSSSPNLTTAQRCSRSNGRSCNVACTSTRPCRPPVSSAPRPPCLSA